MKPINKQTYDDMKKLGILKTTYILDERTGKKYPEMNYRTTKNGKCYVVEPILKEYYIDIYGEEYVKGLNW